MEPRESTAWRRLSWLVLLHTRSGAAQWESAGRVVQHRPGTLVAIAPEFHHHQLVGSQWWHTGYLLLQGPWLTPIISALQAAGGVMVMEADRRVRQDFEAVIEATLGCADGWDWQVAASLAQVLGRVQAASRADDAHLALSERLTRLVDGDLAHAWSVPALARRLGWSVSSLAHRCVVETGLSPAAWVRHRRAEHAQALLAAGMTVTAVSERLGFANPYHFTRVIRQEFGVPPSRLVTAPPPGPLSGSATRRSTRASLRTAL